MAARNAAPPRLRIAVSLAEGTGFPRKIGSRWAPKAPPNGGKPTTMAIAPRGRLGNNAEKAVSPVSARYAARKVPSSGSTIQLWIWCAATQAVASRNTRRCILATPTTESMFWIATAT